MHPIFIKSLVIGLLSLTTVQIGAAQTWLPESLAANDSLQQAQAGKSPESMQRVRDSLEISLLRTTQTYLQVERLVASFPPDSKYLNLLPSVIPVNLPLESFRISSPFGLRQHPIHQQRRFHAGVDIKARWGLMVKATAPGVVRRAGYDPVLGAFVQLQHAFGFETTYGHLAGYCVQPGQRLQRNQEVGRVGQTGQATGPHLHYVIKKNGSVVDPYDFCFLLRRRLSYYEENSNASGVPAPEVANGLLSSGK